MWHRWLFPDYRHWHKLVHNDSINWNIFMIYIIHLIFTFIYKASRFNSSGRPCTTVSNTPPALIFPVCFSHLCPHAHTSPRIGLPPSLCLCRPLPWCVCLLVESLYVALKNIDRADIVTSLEGQAPQPGPGSSEEGACRLGDRDSTFLSPSVINGKTHKHIKYHTHTHDQQYSDKCNYLSAINNPSRVKRQCSYLVVKICI